LSYYAPFEGSWTRERLDGCREAMTRSGRNASDIVESDCDRSVSPSSIRQSQFAYECAGDFLATPRELWGIVAANDHCAWGLLQAASELGLAAGRDFGLVGFDDLSRSRDLGLTSFQPPLDAMGRQAGDLICKALRGEQIPMQMRLKSHLVPRESTRRLVAPAS